MLLAIVFVLFLSVISAEENDTSAPNYSGIISRKRFGLSFNNRCASRNKVFKCMTKCKSLGFQKFQLNYKCKCSCQEVKKPVDLPFFKWRTNGTTKKLPTTRSIKLYEIYGTLFTPKKKTNPRTSPKTKTTAKPIDSPKGESTLDPKATEPNITMTTTDGKMMDGKTPDDKTTNETSTNETTTNETTTNETTTNETTTNETTTNETMTNETTKNETKMAPEIKQLTTDTPKYGANPHWDDAEKALYYVDIEEMKIHKFVYDTGVDTSSEPLSAKPTFIIPIENSKNNFVVGLGKNVMEIEWLGDASKITEPTDASKITEIDKNNLLIAKADSKGRLFIGAKDDTTKKDSLYCIDKVKAPAATKVENLGEIETIDGFCWDNTEKIFYFVDCTQKVIKKCEYNVDTGAFTNPNPVYTYTDHTCTAEKEGMTIDTDGNLWVANYAGTQVLQINPTDGKVLNKIALPPDTKATSVTFGGPDLDILYVTSEGKGTYKIAGLGVKGHRNFNVKMAAGTPPEGELKVEAIAEIQVKHSSSPHWDKEKGALLFIDVIDKKICKYIFKDKKLETATIDAATDPPTFIIPIVGTEDHFVVGLGQKVANIEWKAGDTTAKEDKAVIDKVDSDNAGNILIAKADPQGKLFFGSFGKNAKGPLFEFKLDAGAITASKVDPPIMILGGFCWPDEKVFHYADDAAIWKCDYDATKLNGITAQADGKELKYSELKIVGVAGMTIDIEGKLWIADSAGTTEVKQIDSTDGKPLKTATITEGKVTSMTFGGSDMDILFVTSENTGDKSVYMVTNLGVKGNPDSGAKIS